MYIPKKYLTIVLSVLVTLIIPAYGMKMSASKEKCTVKRQRDKLIALLDGAIEELELVRRGTKIEIEKVLGGIRGTLFVAYDYIKEIPVSRFSDIEKEVDVLYHFFNDICIIIERFETAIREHDNHYLEIIVDHLKARLGKNIHKIYNDDFMNIAQSLLNGKTCVVFKNELTDKMERLVQRLQDISEGQLPSYKRNQKKEIGFQDIFEAPQFNEPVVPLLRLDLLQKFDQGKQHFGTSVLNVYDGADDEYKKDNYNDDDSRDGIKKGEGRLNLSIGFQEKSAKDKHFLENDIKRLKKQLEMLRCVIAQETDQQKKDSLEYKCAEIVIKIEEKKEELRWLYW